MLYSALLALFLTGTAMAENPVLTHQGRVTDALGVPVNSTVSLRVSLFNTELASTAFWTRDYPSMVLQDGYYAVALVLDDDNDPLLLTDFQGGEAWVEVEVNNALMGGREPLASVPFAANAASVTLPDQTPGTCGTAGALYWDSGTNSLAVCDGTTAQVIADPADIISIVESGSLNVNGDVSVTNGVFAPSVGNAGWLQQTAYAVCASKFPTMRYLESPSSTQTCSSKCADSEKPGASCLGSFATGGNLTPWNNYGCNTANSSLQWCCCSW